jgi:membrane protein
MAKSAAAQPLVRHPVRRVRAVVDLWKERLGRHNSLTYASAIAFQALKALVPMSLLGIALLGELGHQDFWRRHVAPALRAHLTQPAYHAIDFAAQRIFSTSSAGVITLGAILTVWYVSGGVRAVMEALNRVFGLQERRPFLRRWGLSLALAVVFSASVVGAILLAAVGPSWGGGVVHGLVLAGRWLLAVLLLIFAVSCLVRWAPVRHERVPKRWASLGGLIVVGTWIVASLVFRWFVASVANFKTATGQLVVFLVLMGYVYTLAIVFLVGVELDELFQEDAKRGDRGILDVLLGRG